MIKRFLADESGATAIEYGLIAVGISTAALVVIDGLGLTLNTIFSNLQASFSPGP
jgi:pilus assembly protein Flp/PilA